jgi:hypothetical protein
MSCDSQYEAFCKQEFQAVNRKLDQLDEAIRGNGKVGIQRRLDRLESSESFRSRALWMLFGAALACAGTVVTKLLGA